MKTIIKSLKILFVLIMVFFYTSCTTDNLEGSTEQNKTIEQALKKVDNLYAFLKGAYDELTSSSYYGRDFIINAEVRSGNCFANGSSGRFSIAAGMVYNENNGFFWGQAYKVIALSNLIIATDLASLEGDKKFGENLKGQAYALRALAHYDLLLVYGQQNVTGGTLGIPYIKKYINQDSPDADFLPTRNTIDEVKGFIFDDLKEAYKLIVQSGKDNPANNIFISSYAVKAIEARVALYFGMWQEAQNAADTVIQSGKYAISKKGDFIKSWNMKNNENSIFELSFSITDTRGINGLAYIYRDQTGYGDVSAMPEVWLSLYDPTDIRKGLLAIERYRWGSYAVNKGKYPDMRGIDNVPVIRYEEIVLTSAEALLELGKTADALVQLNSLAKERGIADYTEATKENIIKERRRELIFEGVYFHDLMRTKQGGVKSNTESEAVTVPYGDYRLAWPIPKREMDANSNMVQNEGY